LRLPVGEPLPGQGTYLLHSLLTVVPARVRAAAANSRPGQQLRPIEAQSRGPVSVAMVPFRPSYRRPGPRGAPTLAELRHRSRAVGVDELERDSSPWSPAVRVELGCCLVDRDHNVRGCADGPTEIEDVQPTEVAGGERVRLTVHFPM